MRTQVVFAIESELWNKWELRNNLTILEITEDLGEEAEPDRAQFQSSTHVRCVLLGVDMKCFLDSDVAWWDGTRNWRPHYCQDQVHATWLEKGRGNPLRNAVVKSNMLVNVCACLLFKVSQQELSLKCTALLYMCNWKVITYNTEFKPISTFPWMRLCLHMGRF